jgi:hypothetical protein
MAVTGSKKKGAYSALSREAMGTAAREEQRALLGLDDEPLRGADWPLTGPADPESVVPDEDELRALEPSEDILRELRKGPE